MPSKSPKLPPVGLIADLAKKDLENFGSHGSFHQAEPGSVLIEQGKPHGKLFFIIDGLFHARRSDGDGDMLLGEISPGGWVGEVDIFDPSNAVCSVVAVKKSQYWVIPRADLQKFIKDFPEAGSILLMGLAGTLGRRIRDLTRKMTEQAELSKIREQLFM
ncbi:MAG: Crp/Fnr family transcriptional regulator [Spartobacteria bacterium]|jgi:CRP-like cAMP-binding protein